ncbi:MAG: hypothetical protein WD696_16190 [Bryobacteraceae bacterium]
MSGRRVFLLSPASLRGERARILLNEHAGFDLAVRLRGQGACLGEIFSFLSGLYFRGKLAYADRFADPPPAVPGSLVIAPGRGLLPPETPVTVATLREISGVPVEASESRYQAPLARDARAISEAIDPECGVVLLGSIATTKYVDPLVEVFGERLLFPAEFVGRGDMSRGGLMLRCVRAGSELAYIPITGSTRRGPRPPRLSRLQRTSW